MIELLYLWERGWLDSATEGFIWKQLGAAFDVDRIMAAPLVTGGPGKVEQFESVDQALATTTSRRVWLMPPGTHEGEDLATYRHPEDAVYIFGNASDDNLRHSSIADDLVSVYTARQVDVFGFNAAAIALYDRMVKRVN